MRRHRLKQLSVVCAASALLAAGCSKSLMPSLPWSSQPVQTNPAAETLFAEGMDYFKNKNYARAIDRFQRVKAEFPFSPQLTEAELKLAEAYYLNKQYPEAIASFKEFQTLHPTNENIPFVLYHLGMAHFDQFTSVDRDQKVTEIAKGYFETVVRTHPSSPYAEKAREKLAKCEQYLAEHEFNIGRFYFNEKNYPAAKDRFQEILRRYPNNPVAPRVLYHLGESYRLEKNTVKAALAYEALTRHYPESPLAKQAETRLAQLDEQKVDPLALLLMRDGRPRFFAAPAPDAHRQKDLNLVAKKEVVHEEPGSEKGFFRRVADSVNPFNWFSSSDEKQKEAPRGKETATAKKESPKPESTGSKEILASVDESLNRQGVQTGGKDPPAPKPSAAELPRAPEEPSPPPSDTAAILATVDARLEKDGKQADRLPPTPEIAPVLQAPGKTEKARTPESLKASQPPGQPATSGLLAGIDEALKRKGIEAPKEGENARKLESQEGTPPSTFPASRPSSSKQIELSPRLPVEKGPLFLETGEFEVTEKASGEAKKPESPEASEHPGSPSSQPPAELPKSVVNSPTQPQAAKPEEKKRAEAAEERGTFDQLKDDLRALGNLLNPFSW